jgi:hypothetical protein
MAIAHVGPTTDSSFVGLFASQALFSKSYAMVKIKQQQKNKNIGSYRS